MNSASRSNQSPVHSEGQREVFHFDGWTGDVDEIPDADGFVELCCREKKDPSVFESIHSSKSTLVLCFEWERQVYYYKEYRYGNVLKRLRGRNRGKHLKRIADLLQREGFETPNVVCHGRSGLRVFVVAEEAKAADSVYDIFMEQTQTPVSDLERFRFLFGQEIGLLHAAGFVHGDLRWGNVLVREAETDKPKFIFIDNDRTKKYRRIPPRFRIKNLVQIKYPGSLLDKPESDWDAMWDGYVAGNPEVRANADVWRNRVDTRNEKRVAAWWKKPRNRHLLEQRKAKEVSNEA